MRARNERIAALEARIAQLEARIAQLERERWVQTTTPPSPQPVYIPPTVAPSYPPRWPEIICGANTYTGTRPQ